MRNVLLLSTSALILAGAVLFGGRRAESTTAEPLAIPPRTVAQFYKGNLHTHTLWSDGDDYPEMVADWYKRHGYQFLALTDHNVLSESERWIDVGPKADKGLEKYLDRFGTTWVERREFAGKNQVRLKPLREFRSQLEVPNRFLLIPAEEISASHAKLPVHLNGINLRDAISPAKADGVAQTIDVHVRAVAAQRKKTGWPMLASLNHPNFGWGVRAEDMAGIEGLQFFEVFNGHPSVRNQGDASHANVERVWDIVLALRLGRLKLPPVYGLRRTTRTVTTNSASAK